MIRPISLSESKVAIDGNVLIMNGNVTSYWQMLPYNYQVMDFDSVERHVDRLHNALSNLYGMTGELNVSMLRLRNVISREETADEIVKTVQMWKKDYTQVPERYKKLLKNMVKESAILAVQIRGKDTVNFETQSAVQIAKNMIGNVIKENLVVGDVSVDPELVHMQNIRIKNILQGFAVPVSPKLLMNIYVNSMFPSYNLVYNQTMVDHADAFIAGMQQEFVPHMGWFEMTNSGVVVFGAVPRMTYGSVLSILEMPDAVRTENFNIAVPGLAVNMHMLKKDAAMLRFKRARAGAFDEAEQAAMANTHDSDINENVDMIQEALRSLRQGRIAVDLDANILVVADTKDDLDAKKRRVISKLADVGVICSIAPNQAKTYMQSFIKRRPVNYNHCMDMHYALSFQMDHGLSIGDGDSGFASPIIGVG